jgi:hypothetical protein
VVVVRGRRRSLHSVFCSACRLFWDSLRTHVTQSLSCFYGVGISTSRSRAVTCQEPRWASVDEKSPKSLIDVAIEKQDSEGMRGSWKLNCGGPGGQELTSCETLSSPVSSRKPVGFVSLTSRRRVRCTAARVKAPLAIAPSPDPAARCTD